MRSPWIAMVVALLACGSPLPAEAGVKGGYFAATGGGYGSGSAYGIDGRFRVDERLELGFEILTIRDAGGKFVYYGIGSSWPGPNEHAPRWSGLTLWSATAGGWYAITESVYAGLTVGAYSTVYEAVGSGDLFSQSGGVSLPGGMAVHAALGYLQPPKVRKHFLFFAEAAFLYHGGSGTLETAPGRIEKVSGPSGFGLFAGVTF